MAGGFISIKAKSADEALQLAEDQLNTSRDNIELNIDAVIRHGFLFMKKTIVFKAKAKQPALETIIEDALNKEHPDSDRIKQENGTAEIIDGRILVNNPVGGGRYAVIVPEPNVRLAVNGHRVTKEAIVCADDVVTFETLSEDSVFQLELEVTDDRMRVFLVVTRKPGRSFRIKNCPPGPVIRVVAETTEEIPPQPVPSSKVMELLLDSGIKYGIDQESIALALGSEHEGSRKFLVASGRPAVPSKNAQIEYVFRDRYQETVNPVNPYHDGYQFSVEPGEILAKKVFPKSGQEGIDVFGETVSPEPPEDMEILTGEGVQLIENGAVAVSVISGRPELKGTKGAQVLKVLPVYTVPGDVDIHVGSITFKGDVVVYGNVLEGFRINAGGNITIHGNVLQAEVIAGESITVGKNIISSEITAGDRILVYRRAKPELKQLSTLISSLLHAMRTVRGHKSFKSDDLERNEGRLIQLLIDTKFKIVPKTIQQFSEIINCGKNVPPEELVQVSRVLQKLTGLNPLRIEKAGEVFDILRVIERVTDKVNEEVEFAKASDVTAEYVQNSDIKASGNIIVTGRGAIISELLAGQDIQITGPRAVVRGGRLTAGGTIKVNELGSNGSVICYVRINEGNVLEAGLVHPAVTVESEFGRYVFGDLSRSVKAYISQNKLEVEKLKAK